MVLTKIALGVHDGHSFRERNAFMAWAMKYNVDLVFKAGYLVLMLWYTKYVQEKAMAIAGLVTAVLIYTAVIANNVHQLSKVF